MPKFRKKPVIIEAEQFSWETNHCKGLCNERFCPASDRAHVHTIHDNQLVEVSEGDWIIPEPDGIHFYPVKPDIFAATYELVTE